MARVLLLVPTRTYRTADFMSAARSLGIEVAIGSEQRSALAGLMRDRMLGVTFEHVDRAVAAIARFAARHPLDAIVAVDDTGTVVAAAASAALGLAGNSVEPVRASRDKGRARERFAAAGLLTPRFQIFGSDADPASVAAAVRYPCVVKPVDLSGSRGVIRADDADSCVAAFTRVGALVRSPDVCRPGSAPQSILVEDFIPGAEFALEGLLRGGVLETLAIFDKPDPLNGPFFEETIYVTPSRQPDAVQAEMAHTVQRATRALGLTEGPVHAEVRRNEAGTFMLEVAARSIGGLCARTLRFGMGVSLEELILRHAVGLPIQSLRREDRAAGVLMLPIPRPGVLRQVRGQEEARQVPGIEGVVLTVPAGERLVPLPEGDRYLGFVFARGPSAADVERALRTAQQHLVVETA
ncbi:MAG TPA: ATP-grasp domain-containing protein [Candidatus Limnocylindria bacterium]|nr:ATP-grasp domain-containing protein [Candidatus Limnocylindria bacterium]